MRSFHVAWTRLLQFTFYGTSYGPTDDPAVVCLARYCTSDGMITSRQCYIVALASGSEAGGFQEGHIGLQFVVWHGIWLRLTYPLTVRSRHKKVVDRQLRPADSRTCVVTRQADGVTYRLQQLRRPMFCRCCPYRLRNGFPADGLRQTDIGYTNSLTATVKTMSQPVLKS